MERKIKTVLKMPPETYVEHFDGTVVRILYKYLDDEALDIGALIIERGKVKSLLGEEFWGCYGHAFKKQN